MSRMSLTPNPSIQSYKKESDNVISKEAGLRNQSSHSKPSGDTASGSSQQSFKYEETATSEQKKTSTTEKQPKKARGYCITPASSSHTHFYRKKPLPDPPDFERITRSKYLGINESMSGSSDTFGCEHPDGRQYTEMGLLKRNLVKYLDPIEIPQKWNECCRPFLGWAMAEKLVFLINDDLVVKQMDRLVDHLDQFAQTAANGFRIDVLDHVCTILDFLVEHYHKFPALREGLQQLLQSLQKPIQLTKASDVLTYAESIGNFVGFMGYMLLRLEEDSYFDLLSRGLQWQLSARKARDAQALRPHVLLAAGGSLIVESVCRMLAFTSPHRFPAFLELALILAVDSEDNCIQMIKDDILENIFSRFNPYFPHKPLPAYEVNPMDPNDMNVKLGDSSKHIQTTMSLLLVLLKTAQDFLKKMPKTRELLPCPDDYALRCYTWAFRYECQSRDHHHERNTFVVITMLILDVFRERLNTFPFMMMPDVLTLSVFTELPHRNDWTVKVNINKTQIDVQFKKWLIHLSIYFLKIFPYNWFLLEHHHWFIGLMYLLDPGLSKLRAHWSTALFAEIKRTALQALILTVPYLPYRIIHEANMMRRLMWYIEWYSVSSYEIAVLYLCVRLLQTSLYKSKSPARGESIKELFKSHGLIIIMELSNTMLKKHQDAPPVEKCQAVLGLCLRIYTSAISPKRTLSCTVYPHIRWPAHINSLGKTVLQLVLFHMNNHFIICDRWLIPILNFIWEGIIWNTEFRKNFIQDGGIYQLLDLITLSDRSIQCLALALLCDVTRTGSAVAQLVTWRACAAASAKHPGLVKRGATIATLLAAVFRDDCKLNGVALDDNGILQDLENGITSTDMLNEIKSPDFFDNRNQRTMVCFAAADFCGSRMSKAYALLQLLSEDLAHLVEIADERYNLYKNVLLSVEDEVMLVLVYHFLTLKLCEAWKETASQNPGLLPCDEQILAEFLQIKDGWTVEVQRMQMDMLKKDKKKNENEENSLYSFFARARLNIALDALQSIKCTARSTDRDRITHLMLHDAVRAYSRRSSLIQKLDDQVIKTYEPMLDDQNITGQFVTVRSIKVPLVTRSENLGHSVCST